MKNIFIILALVFCSLQVRGQIFLSEIQDTVGKGYVPITDYDPALATYIQKYMLLQDYLEDSISWASVPVGLHDAVTLAGSYDYITLSGQVITRNQIDLTTDVTGLLPYASLSGAPTLLSQFTDDLGHIEESTTVTDLANGLDISLSTYDITVSPDFTELTTETTIDNTDYVIIHDATTPNDGKITYANLLADIVSDASLDLEQVLTNGNDAGGLDALNFSEVESDEFIGDLRGAVLFKAQAGEALAKGDVVYVSGISGNTTIVSKADADDAAKMPAFGVVAASASLNNPVDIYTFGTLSNLNTSAFTIGDILYVSTTAGQLTATPPTGESALLQNIAKVTRVDNSAGSIKISGAGRTNATPNLNTGRLFVGNASNQAVADGTIYVDIANSRVGIGVTPSAKLDVNGDVEIATVNTDNTTDDVLVHSSDGTVSKRTLTSIGDEIDLNLGDDNLTLSGFRTLNLSNNDLSFQMNGTGVGHGGFWYFDASANALLNYSKDNGSGGNYGIFGMSNPSSGFDLVERFNFFGGDGTSNYNIRIFDQTSTTGAKEVRIYNGALRLYDSGSASDIYLNPNGDSYIINNLGIGTSSPSVKFEVDGGDAVIRNSANTNLKIWDDAPSGGGWVTINANRGTNHILGVTIGADWGNTPNLGRLESKLNGESYILHTKDYVDGTETVSLRETVLNEGGLDIDFRVESTTSTNALFVDASTNRVGIGTTSPNAKLHVESDAIGTALNDGGIVARLHGEAGNNLNLDYSIKRIAAGSNWFNTEQKLSFNVDGNSSKDVWIKSINATSTSDNILAFGEGASTEWMRIDNGNVGIGTTSPSEMLHISNNQDASTRLRISNTSTGTSARTGFSLWNGTGGGDNAFFHVTGQNYSGVTGWNDRLVVQSGSTLSKGMIFYASTGGITFSNSTTNSPDLYVSDGGNVGIGTASPSAKLTVDENANVGFEVFGGNVGRDIARFHRDIGTNTTVGINGNGSAAQMYFENPSGGFYSLGNDFNGDFQIANSQYIGTNVRLHIEATTGNVGIGTSSPSSIFNVEYDDFGGGDGLTFKNTNTSSSANAVVAIINGGTTGGDPITRYNLVGEGSWYFGADNDNSNVLYANWNSSGVNELELDNAGNLSIANTLTINSDDPSNKYSLPANDGTANQYLKTDGSGNVSWSTIAGSTDDQTLSEVLAQGNDAGGQAANNFSTISIGTTTETGYSLYIRETNPNIGFYDTDITSHANNISGNAGHLAYSVDPLSVGSYFHLWYGNGSEIMRLTDTGNLGIGTSSPSNKLHVLDGSNEARFGNITGVNYIQGLFKSSASSGGIRLENSTGYQWEVQSLASQDKFIIYDRTAAEFRLVIDNSGNVGIGTTSPDSKLEVANSTNFNPSSTTTTPAIVSSGNYGGAIALSDTKESGMYAHTGGTRLSFYVGRTNGSNTATSKTVMSLLDTGNVGIGTTSPTHELEVNGDVLIQDYMRIGGTGTANDIIMGVVGLTNILSVSNYPFKIDLTTASEDFIIETGGISDIQAVTVDGATGNVGLTQPNPSAKLDVVGDTELNGSLLVDNGVIDADAITNNISMSSPTVTVGDNTTIQLESNIGYNTIQFNGGSLRFSNGTTEHLNILSDGDLDWSGRAVGELFSNSDNTSSTTYSKIDFTVEVLDLGDATPSTANDDIELTSVGYYNVEIVGFFWNDGDSSTECEVALFRDTTEEASVAPVGSKFTNIIYKSPDPTTLMTTKLMSISGGDNLSVQFKRVSGTGTCHCEDVRLHVSRVGLLD